MYAMITCDQIKMSRAALGWGVRELAVKTGVPANTISKIENGSDARVSTLTTIQKTIEAAGIEFISENGGGVGVRYKEPR